MGFALRKLLFALVVVLVVATPASSYTDPLLCIKHYESDCCGGWSANTHNGYYGGLQMNRVFQEVYGPAFYHRWGTANNWPAWAQLTAGHRAVASRGYSPWPHTRYSCNV